MKSINEEEIIVHCPLCKEEIKKCFKNMKPNKMIMKMKD